MSPLQAQPEPDPVAANARAAAERLAPEFGANVVGDVEAALHARHAAPQPEQRYFDPMSLGALIVSAAQLAWTIYTDLKNKTTEPSPDVVARTVRVELRNAEPTAAAAQDRIIDIVVNQTVQAANKPSS